MQLIKKCIKCKIEKELDCFGKQKRGKDGLRARCISCRREYNKEYNKTNADKRKEYHKVNANKRKEYNKEYRKANTDKIKEYHKKYYNANANKIKQHRKEYRKANADKLKEYHKANTDKRKEWNKEYYKINANKYKEYQKANAYKINKNIRERRETDPLFKLSGSIRSLIRGTFKRGVNNLTKSKRTEEILGCSLMFFQTYIKGQFKKGMTLDNHGEWHLDHIKPIASAQTKEEIIALNHYTNFQPLWAKDNMLKSDKIIEKQLKLL